MSAKRLGAFAVGIQDRLINPRRIGFQPGKQCGAEIKADSGVIIEDVGNEILIIENTRGRIGRVTLGSYPLIPIVIRISGILLLHGFQPGIFARRLVEVVMNTDVTH